MSRYSDALIKFIPMNFALTRSTYKVSDLSRNPQEAIRIATAALSTANSQLKEAAQQVIEEATQMLAGGFNSAGAPAVVPATVAIPVTQPAPAPTSIAAPIPESIAIPMIPASQSFPELDPVARKRAWDRFESVMVGQVGPLGGKIASKLNATFPDRMPIDCRKQCEAILGHDQTRAVFANLGR